MADDTLDTYDAEHIRERLIADPRTGALDVRVRLVGDALVVAGDVATEERRTTIIAVVTDLAPGIQIRDDLTVTDVPEPDDHEVVS